MEDLRLDLCGVDEEDCACVTNGDAVADLGPCVDCIGATVAL